MSLAVKRYNEVESENNYTGRQVPDKYTTAEYPVKVTKQLIYK
jgi:hypothetical protein